MYRQGETAHLFDAHLSHLPLQFAVERSKNGVTLLTTLYLSFIREQFWGQSPQNPSLLLLMQRHFSRMLPTVHDRDMDGSSDSMRTWATLSFRGERRQEQYAVLQDDKAIKKAIPDDKLTHLEIGNRQCASALGYQYSLASGLGLELTVTYVVFTLYLHYYKMLEKVGHRFEMS